MLEDVVEVVFGLSELADRGVVHAAQGVEDHFELIEGRSLAQLLFAIEELEAFAVGFEGLEVILPAEELIGLRN